MQNHEPKGRKEAYIKPEVHTHEPLRNITAVGPGGEPTIIKPTRIDFD